MSWKRFILVGIPGSGKSKLAADLEHGLHGTIMVHRGSASDYFHSEDFAIGPQMDYRAELLLATQRTMAHLSKAHAHIVFDGSLIDSFAYSIRRYQRHLKYANVSDGTETRDLLISILIGAMLRDSLEYDHIFFLEAEPVDDEEEALQDRMKEILDTTGAKYTLLRKDEREQWSEQAIEIVKEHIGQGNAESESSSQED